MSPAYTNKLIVSTIALTLALGGLCTVNQGAYAETGSALTHSQKQGGILQKHPTAHQGRWKHGKSFPVLDEAASIMGIDKETLTKSLKDGNSIVDVARKKGISEADLTAKLLELRRGRIDEAVKAGKIDTDKAERMKQRMAEHLKLMLNDKKLLDQHSG